MTSQELARQAVNDFNTYQSHAWALGHASTSEEMVKLMTMAIDKAMTYERLTICRKVLELRDEMQEGPDRDKVNELANELHHD